MKFSIEEQSQILALADIEDCEENKAMWLNKCPQISLFVKKAIHHAFQYALTNCNLFNELPMTKEDLNTVNTEYIDLFEESRADNVLIQSGILDKLVETSDKEAKQDIVKEFMFHLKRDGFSRLSS